MSIGDRLAAIHRTINEARSAAGRTDDVTLVAVTKTMPPSRIEEAFAAGQRVFGENRVQEALEKIDALQHSMPDARWHFIGHLQTNKVKQIHQRFAFIESVDSLRLATRLNQVAAADGRRQPVLLEVNVAGEPSKGGFVAAELPELIPPLRQLEALRLCGLMTVAPLSENAQEVRPTFRCLRELRDSLRDAFDLPDLRELSMGMSNDYQIAVEEGATMIRIGRAIFGERSDSVVPRSP